MVRGTLIRGRIRCSNDGRSLLLSSYAAAPIHGGSYLLVGTTTATGGPAISGYVAMHSSGLPTLPIAEGLSARRRPSVFPQPVSADPPMPPMSPRADDSPM